MDPYIANLDLDPPRHSSELLFGLVPALLLNAAFFGVVLLGSQPGDLDPTIASAPPPSTREMGGPAATPETTGTTLAPTGALREGPAAPDARATPAPAAATVARADPQAGSAAAPRPAAPPRVSPSFDCNQARLKNDRLICSDPELSQLDRDLGRLYAQARAAAPDPAAFKRESDRAWARREAECGDKACLQRWYAERRAQLQAGLNGRRQATGSATR